MALIEDRDAAHNWCCGTMSVVPRLSGRLVFVGLDNFGDQTVTNDIFGRQLGNPNAFDILQPPKCINQATLVRGGKSTCV